MNAPLKPPTTKDTLKFLVSDDFSFVRKIIYIAISVLSMIGLFILFFCPICESIYWIDGYYSPTPMGCFEALNDGPIYVTAAALFQFGLFVAIAVAIAFNGILLIRGLLSLSSEEVLSANTKKILILDFIFVTIFVMFTFLLSPINMMTGGDLLNGESTASLNLLPMAYMALPCLLYAIFSGLLSFLTEKRDDKVLFEKKARMAIEQKRKALFWTRLELLLYALLTPALAILALLSNIITVTFESNYISDLPTIELSGWDLLTDMSTQVSEGKRLLTFALFVFFILTITVAFLSLVSCIGRSHLFGKIGIASVSVSSAISLVVGLIGKYYAIMQHLNEGLLFDCVSELENYEFLLSQALSYTVTSNSLYFFGGALLIVAMLFFRRPYTKGEALLKEIAADEAARLPQKVEVTEIENAGTDKNPAPKKTETVQTPTYIKDPCPAFTAIDQKCGEFNRLFDERRSNLLDSPSLPKLVDFIVQYARESRLHLFYTPETIAEFLAGLGTTRLSILQGMSGTGKTSLPKIVSEALFSTCDIVEVESSWRDKNELLGYYNEFSKIFTPKKFTEALYKATLNPEVPTFIVLDEMNLSRIEYYFSDFLSLMENEPDKRELKLLNTPLFRTYENGAKQGFFGLTDGCVIKIPQNVWFIGTANRDESTYDISDKVYDRAHTMNFDKRAIKVPFYNAPLIPQFVPIAALLWLFDNAKATINFNLDQYPVVAEVEKLLAPYNISFGNRISMQIESFVKIYAACFGGNENAIMDALEIILLSKVVRKLELKTIDDKEELAAAFAKLRLPRCSEFIASIKED